MPLPITTKTNNAISIFVTKKLTALERLFAFNIYLLFVISVAEPLLKNQRSQQHVRESLTRILSAPQVQANWRSSLPNSELNPDESQTSSESVHGARSWSLTLKSASRSTNKIKDSYIAYIYLILQEFSFKMTAKRKKSRPWHQNVSGLVKKSMPIFK